jgi:DNA primase
VDEVVLCFDSDEAGQNAAVRSLDHLLGSGLAVRVAVMPAPHDPDSFIKAEGGGAFKQLVERAEGFFDYYLNRLCATNEVTSDKGRLAVLRGMAEAVYKTGNVVLIDTYSQKTALRLGVSPEAVRAEFKKTRQPRKEAPEPAEVTEGEAAPKRQLAALEAALLKLVLETDEHVGWVAEHLNPEWLSDSAVREVVVRRLELHRAGEWHGVPDFVTAVEAARDLITEIVVQPLVENVDGTKSPRNKPMPNAAQQLADIARRLRDQFIDRQMAALNQRMNHPETSDGERLELLRQQQELRALKRQAV